MANTLNLGTDGNWAVKENNLLAYNDENNIFKPIDFDFTRDSGATRVNEQGLIENVPIGVPRIDFSDGKGSLLLEPERRNLVQYSEDIESWGTIGVITKQNNVSISPDGTLNAGTITSNASNFDRITQTISVSANSTYTGSLFIKKVQSQTNYMGIGFIFTGGTTDVGYVIFDAVNGIAVSADARIDVISEVKDFGDYWRLQSTATDNGSNTSLQFNIYATLSTNGTTTGLGISSPRTIWGLQLEQGSYATSYIPTSGSAVTRTLEISEVYNLDDYVSSETSWTATGEFVKGQDKDNSKYIFYAYYLASSNLFRIRDFNNTVRFYLFEPSEQSYGFTATLGQTIKWAIRAKSDGTYSLYVNGGLFVETSGTFRKLDAYRLFGNAKVSVNNLKVYNTALTDAELQQLTS